MAGLDADMVLDIADTPATIGDILDGMAHAPLGHRSVEGHATVLDVDTDIADIDVVFFAQPFADGFTQAFVGTREVFGTLAGVGAVAMALLAARRALATAE